MALIATYFVTRVPATHGRGGRSVAAGCGDHPTDAGLGAPTVAQPGGPHRVRRALNVESGLNDGLATPIVLLALAALAAEEAHRNPRFCR
jgi:NhaP-type Na+/H+ or K+/H+ antiporter